MPFDRTFDHDARSFRGYTSHRSGLAAEAQVSAHYRYAGYTLRAERWRGPGGEIDLIFERDGEITFVEVKKSSCVERAAARLSARQLQSLIASADAFLGQEPRGLLTQARFDLAAVGGQGEIAILENITGL